MKKTFNSAFFVGVFAVGVILLRWPMDDARLAQKRLGALVQDDLRLRDQVTAACATVGLELNTPLERTLKERLKPSPDGNGTACTIAVAEAHATRFALRSYWDFHVEIRNPSHVALAARRYTLEFPRPLVLWPLLIFGLALVFSFRPWGMGWTLGSYLTLLCGLNLLQLVQKSVAGLAVTFSLDQPWTGLFLLAGWVALCQARRVPSENLRARPPRMTREARWLNRGVLSLVALWNPVAFTLTGRLLVPFQSRVALLSPFLGLQVAAMALSLYLLALDLQHPWATLGHSLILPRYFTFGALLFVLLHFHGPKREPVAWALPGFWRGIVFVVLFEIGAWAFDISESTSTLTRVGAALFLSQLVWPRYIDWQRAAHYAGRWGAALGIAALVATTSHQLGIADLALSVFDPLIHPSSAALFTFLAGILLGFLTGNFSTAFFALFATLMKTEQTNLIRAALLDGVMAGLLFSPFSVHNLVPSIQFRLPMAAVIAFRFRQLGIPLAIGMGIYALSALNSVAILRPATFVFLCLVAIATQLRKTAWRVGDYTILPSSHNGAR